LQVKHKDDKKRIRLGDGPVISFTRISQALA